MCANASTYARSKVGSSFRWDVHTGHVARLITRHISASVASYGSTELQPVHASRHCRKELFLHNNHQQIYQFLVSLRVGVGAHVKGGEWDVKIAQLLYRTINRGTIFVTTWKEILLQFSTLLSYSPSDTNTTRRLRPISHASLLVIPLTAVSTPLKEGSLRKRD